MKSTRAWTRSSFCSDATCVEVIDDEDHVALRDGKNVDIEAIRVPRSVWEGFLQGVVAGDYPQ